MSLLTPIRTNQAALDPKRSPRIAPLALAEAPKFLQVMANSPAALRAYILADAALVRGQLTGGQRKQVALAVAKINRSNSSRSARSATGESPALPGDNLHLAGNAAAADPTTEVILCITQAIILRRGEISDEDFQTRHKAGFSDVHIAEIVASIALKIFSRHFKSAALTEADFLVLEPGAEPRALASAPSN